jgi:hypothetical protein
MIIEFLAKTSDIVGVTGVFIILIAYFLLSINRMSSQSLNYQLCNFIGATFTLYSLMFNFNLASVVIEVFWIIISVMGIYRIQLARKPVNIEGGNIVSLKDVRSKS